MGGGGGGSVGGRVSWGGPRGGEGIKRSPRVVRVGRCVSGCAARRRGSGEGGRGLVELWEGGGGGYGGGAGGRVDGGG